jgi:putative ABC transport system permease protein
MILRNLLRRRTRTLLTLVGVSLGVAAIVSLVAVANGLIGGYSQLWSGGEADMSVSQAEALDPSVSVIYESVGEELLKVGGIEAVAGMVYGEVTTDQVPYLLVFGHDPEGFAIEHFKIVEGEGLTPRSRNEIIIGKGASDSLNKAIGDTIRMYDSAYRIVGIYETGQGLEEGGGVITLADAQAMLKRPRQVNVFQVQLRVGAEADAVRERIDFRAHQGDRVAAGLGLAEEQGVAHDPDGVHRAQSRGRGPGFGTGNRHRVALREDPGDRRPDAG